MSNTLPKPSKTYDANNDAQTRLQITQSLNAMSQTISQNATPSVVTFANLPAFPISGQRAFVTDSNTSIFYATAAAGGANFVPVFYNGTNWIVG